MGGNLLKHITERVERTTYFKLAAEVIDKLGALVSDVRLVKAYQDKQSFGDMDLLVVWADSLDIPDWEEELKNRLRRRFEPKEIHINGDVVTFDYKNVQIDLITTTSGEIDMAMFYFSYNDLGNLLGRLAYTRGMRLKHNGLFYHYTDSTGQHHDIRLTTNQTKILYLLGLNTNNYDAGFYQLTDIFEFVASSQLFKPSMFSLEALNHINRTRNRKRAVYMEFLQWIEKQGFNDDMFSDSTKVGSTMTYSGPIWQEIVGEYTKTPLLDEINKLEAGILARQTYRNKVNARLVQRLSGLSPGAWLGVVMHELGNGLPELGHPWWEVSRQVTINNAVFDALRQLTLDGKDADCRFNEHISKLLGTVVEGDIPKYTTDIREWNALLQGFSMFDMRKYVKHLLMVVGEHFNDWGDQCEDDYSYVARATAWEHSKAYILWKTANV